MRGPRVAAALLFSLLALAPVAGCGDSGDAPTLATVASRPPPPAADFPSAEGKTLSELLNSCYPPSEEKRACGPATVSVTPLSEVFYKGENQYSIAISTISSDDQISDSDVALYFSRVPASDASTIPGDSADTTGAAATGATGAVGATGASGETGPLGPLALPGVPESQADLPTALDEPANGPFPASVISLATDPDFTADSTRADPLTATSVYRATVDFPKNGEWRIVAVIKDGDTFESALLPSAVVGQFTEIPEVGDRPPRIHTPTPQEVGGDLSKLTTRDPPEDMNQVDFYDALGNYPIVLLFSSPEFCESRVCGPALDIAEQVRDETSPSVKFIHMEIFKDNKPGNGVRPQVRAFNLPSQPWLFVIDRNGIVRTVVEGAFSVGEMEQAVQQVSG